MTGSGHGTPRAVCSCGGLFGGCGKTSGVIAWFAWFTLEERWYALPTIECGLRSEAMSEPMNCAELTLCVWCEKTYHKKRRDMVYCGRPCRDAASHRKRHPLPEVETRTCAQCRAKFTTRPRKKASIYCSKRCGVRACQARKKYRRGTTHRDCVQCGKAFETGKKGKSTARFCSLRCASTHNNGRPERREQVRVQMSRPWSVERVARERLRRPDVTITCCACGKSWQRRSQGKKHNAQKYCLACSRAKGMRAAYRYWKGRHNPHAAARMRGPKNPMHNPEYVEKMRLKMVGRTFLARGGNSKITPQQERVATFFQAPVEFAVPTKSVRGQFPSLPPCYKVDVGFPDVRLAVEIDGNSHKLKKWKFLDHRKTAVLNALGWCVLRFWNQEVDEDIDQVVATITSTILKLKTSTTTSPLVL